MKTLRLIWPSILGAGIGSTGTAVIAGPMEGLRVFVTVVALCWCIAELIVRIQTRRAFLPKGNANG